MSFNGELFQIFSWLSVKDLCKYSSICKEAKEVLTEELFIKKQFRNMQLVDDTGFLIQYWLQGLEFHASSSNSSERCSLPSESITFLQNTGFNIIASSNGLLFLKNMADESNPLFVFNPATKKLLQIPLADNMEMNDLNNIIFSCNGDEVTGDQYLLMVLKSPEDWNGDFHSYFYSPEEQVWKDGHSVNLGKRNIYFENSVYQNGVVYLISDWGNPLVKPYIVAYNIKNGVSRILKLPISANKGLQLQDNRSCKIKLCNYGNSRNFSESIALVKYYKSVFTVWLLDSKEGSWSRIFKMRGKAMGVLARNEIHVAGFTIQNGNILLVATEDKVYSYNMIEDNCVELCKHKCEGSVDFQYLYGDCVRFHSFISTLRPCGKGQKDVLELEHKFCLIL